MGTRANIARPLPDDPTGQRWEGVYVHKDGFPGRTGAFLHRQVSRQFPSPADARAYFLEDHRHGFSYVDSDVADNDCYCHRDPADLDMDNYAAPETCERWIYLIRDDGLEVRSDDMPLGPGLLVPWEEDDTDWARVERAVVARAERRAAAPRS